MANNVETCKICTGDETSYEDPLIAPCNCCGSIKWVHKSCLDHWRTFSQANFGKCDICKKDFKLKHIEVTTALYYQQCKRYYLYMTRDITITLVAWNILCLTIGYVSNRYQWFSYIDIVAINPYIYYWLFGNLVACFITGIISILVALFAILAYTDNGGNGGNALNDWDRAFGRPTININNYGNNTNSANSTNSTNSNAAKENKKTSSNRIVNKTDSCTMCIVLVGIVTICYSSIWLVGYLAKRHSDRTWRKELAKTQIVVPKESIPDSYAREYI